MSTPSPRPRAHRILLGAALALLLAVAAGACGSAAGYSADSSQATVDLTLAPATSTTTTAPPTTTTTEPPTTTTEPPLPPLPQFGGSALGAGPNTLYVLGDSVTLGAQSTVPPALGGWDVTFDAKESRRIDQGTAIVRERGGQMGRVLVVHLCTNWGGGDYRAAADHLLDSLVGVERVVWVTCTPWLPAVADADAVIRSLPASHPGVVVADWAAVSGTPGYTYADGLHLKPDGAAGLAQVIAAAVGPPPG